MTITLEDAQRRLPELIAALKPGDELIITRDSQPVAQVVPVADYSPQAVFGSCRDKLTILAEDDKHLADFKEYMP